VVGMRCPRDNEYVGCKAADAVAKGECATALNAVRNIRAMTIRHHSPSIGSSRDAV
jgi:hypothetical protein